MTPAKNYFEHVLFLFSRSPAHLVHLVDSFLIKSLVNKLHQQRLFFFFQLRYVRNP